MAGLIKLLKRGIIGSLLLNSAVNGAFADNDVFLCPNLFAPADLKYLLDARTQPFKNSGATCTVDGKTTLFRESELRPMKDGSYTLEFTDRTDPKDTVRVRVYLLSKGLPQNQSIALPQLAGKDDRSGLTYFRGNPHSNSGSGSENVGQVRFLGEKSGRVPGYICVRFMSQRHRPSEINGYFYATINKNIRTYNGAMYDKNEFDG